MLVHGAKLTSGSSEKEPSDSVSNNSPSEPVSRYPLGHLCMCQHQCLSLPTPRGTPSNTRVTECRAFHSGSNGTSLFNVLHHLQTDPHLGLEDEESYRNLQIQSSLSLKKQVCHDGSHQQKPIDARNMCHPTPRGWAWRLRHRAVSRDLKSSWSLYLSWHDTVLRSRREEKATSLSGQRVLVSHSSAEPTGSGCLSCCLHMVQTWGGSFLKHLHLHLNCPQAHAGCSPSHALLNFAAWRGIEAWALGLTVPPPMSPFRGSHFYTISKADSFFWGVFSFPGDYRTI